ncbi:hypothetical protein Hanom_Chr17g01568071 [Helianthus anomalus]
MKFNLKKEGLIYIVLKQKVGGYNATDTNYNFTLCLKLRFSLHSGKHNTNSQVHPNSLQRPPPCPPWR